MRRRTFLGAVAAGSVAGPAVVSGGSADARTADTGRSETIPELMLDSTGCLLDADGKPLTDESLIAVWAEEAARVTDADDGGDAVTYGDTAIPLVAVDGNVAGLGAPIVKNEVDFAYGVEEFYLNLWDELIGSGTVLWDEGHQQYYDLEKHEQFKSYAGDRGYSVEATTSLQSDLSGADGVVITTPTEGLSGAERSALSTFAANGGGVILHTQSDYRNFDATDNLNQAAADLGVGFRFNDGQVVDEENNTGPNFTITTKRFNTEAFGPLFENRRGIGAGPRFAYDKKYTATVKKVYDGDTFQVAFPDGGTDEVRVLGVDTPEVPEAAEFEMPHEWEGLGGRAVDQDYPYLSSWGRKASKYAKSTLEGTEVTLSFDRKEGIKDPFGRVLAYVETGGSLYSKDLIRKGYARVFDSSLQRHDELLKVELQARKQGRGLWAKSDPSKSKPFRTGPVTKLFFPNPAPVTRVEGSLEDARVPVRAESSASTPEAPLVGVDAGNRVAVVSAPVVSEAYEKATGYPVSTASFGNFTFLTNLIDALAERDGDVLVAGAHGQFGSGAALSAEEMSFYQRHLEGHDIGLEGVNSLAGSLLDRGRALIVSTPPNALRDAELKAIRSFRDAGGAVVLLGSAAASTAARVNLNSVATALGSDLRVSLSSVTDPQANLNGEAAVLTTTNFEDAFGLFGAYEPGAATLPSQGTPTATPTDTPADTGTGTATGTSPGTSTGTPVSSPGLGVGSAVAGAAGGALALRRLRDDD